MEECSAHKKFEKDRGILLHRELAGKENNQIQLYESISSLHITVLNSIYFIFDRSNKYIFNLEFIQN